jgi:hypothetical protein
MLFKFSWSTKRKLTITAHWGKFLPRQQQQSIKKVAITQGKIRYKMGRM